ncbi:septation ring formation regulator EzrA [Bacillus cereus]|uniref:septation ring formation regulator EzrA n=1 Tax=Bacillus cereus TaxID=1396 RepID=UPI00114595CC|nr:septation ring formation regulator EzrA [Bacillus cereus]
MKAKGILSATILSTTLFGGFGLSTAAAEGNFSPAQKKEVVELKQNGLTDKQVQEYINIAEKDKKFFAKEAKQKAANDIANLKKLKNSQQNFVAGAKASEGEYVKLNDPEYKDILSDSKSTDSKATISTLATKSPLGTKGDVLVSYEINSGSSAIGVGHSAIVSRDYTRTVESFAQSWSPIGKNGVQYYQNTWKGRSKVYGLWVKGASNTKYYNAAGYAQSKIGSSYNWNFFNKFSTSSFYCSQLAWRSWEQQGINIDYVTWDTVVSPAELVKSGNTTIFYSN